MIHLRAIEIDTMYLGTAAEDCVHDTQAVVWT